jgi:tRNA/rRNA methyltransferase
LETDLNTVTEVSQDESTLNIRVDGGEPVLGPQGTRVAEVVHACHSASIDQGLEALRIPGLTRETLEPVLQYCARLQCVSDAVTCPGCKRRTEVQGIETLDQFILSKNEVVVGDGRVRLHGEGTETVTTPCLETLAKQWSGENYWFWARRVIRKLRHGLRRAHMRGEPVAGEGETPSVILMEPQLADNIGMVARACANFGLDDLRLVNPRDGWPNEKARIAASGANYIIDDARAFPTLEESIADLNWVAATTARQRDLRKPVLSPEQAIAEMRVRIGRGERCGVLFGRERRR